MKKEKAHGKRIKVDRNMRELLIGKEVPKSAFVLALLLYGVATFFLLKASRSVKVFHLWNGYRR
jgi:hypothetical protein